MFRKSFQVALLLCTIMSFSQEVVKSIPLEFKANRDVFQIVNESTKKIVFFASDKKFISAFSIDEKFQILDTLKTDRPEKKFADIAGFSGDKSNPRLYWISEDHKEIYSQFFNFTNKTITSQEYKIEMKGEKFVQYFSENNLFYMVTVLKESSTLKFYIFDKDGKKTEKTVDSPNMFFYNSENKKTNLYGILKEEVNLQGSFLVQRINPENSTSLANSSKKRKCYSKNNVVFLTIDSYWDYTQLVIIDLNSFSVQQKFIKQPFINFNEKFEIDSNSFLMDDKLYQIKANYTDLIVSIKTLDDVLLKELKIENDRVIDFKNSEIIQKGNAFGEGDRVLEKTSQFLRKIVNNNCGISCYKLNGEILLTIGGVSDLKGASGGPVFFGGVGFGTPTSFNGFGGAYPMPMFNYRYVNLTYDDYNSYKNRKVIYINCLFDEEGNHLSGEVKPLAFDKIQDFLKIDNNSKSDIFTNPQNQIDSETVFKIDSTYFLGYFDKETKSYTIRKFED